MQCGSSSGQVSIVESTGICVQDLSEELDEVAELAGLVALVGSAAELAGSAAEVAGAAEELVGESAALFGVAAELLDSIADEMASKTSLLIGSWLRGMSTILLELLA
jgi:hypothetical protein